MDLQIQRHDETTEVVSTHYEVAGHGHEADISARVEDGFIVMVGKSIEGETTCRVPIAMAQIFAETLAHVAVDLEQEER